MHLVTRSHPFFIFPGARMQPALMEGAASGWSNTDIFSTYMRYHLEPLFPARSCHNPVLVLYDGHKSHVSLGLEEWAREQNRVLFVLPPSTAHG